jgi:hypothetical protein
MKKTIVFIKCATDKIKKIFFNLEKDQKGQSCEQFKMMNDEVKNMEEIQRTEEYLNNYQLTTRWQTL